MSKILKNDSGGLITINDTGVSIPDSTQYTIPPQDYLLWAASSDVITFIGAADLVVNDGSFDLSISDGVDLIKGLFPSTVQLTPKPTLIEYDDVTSVASGISTTVISYTALVEQYLLLASASGTNIARFQVKLNSTIIDQAYTYFGSGLNYNFKFGQGLFIDIGDLIEIEVLHNRPTSGDFNAKLALINA